MENSLWNLVLRASSALAAASILLAAAMTLASFTGATRNVGAGVVTVIFAAIICILALAALNYSHGKLVREVRDAVNLSHLLSQGVSSEENRADSELLRSLNEVSGYIRERSEIVDKIAEGVLPEKVVARSDSDLLGHSLQNLLDHLRTDGQTRETRDRLQQSLIQLMDEVSGVAAGDLTVQASVGHEITGGIADAFNSMTRNLRSLIRKVKDVTIQVGESATAINETTDQLARGSIAQASQISRTTAAISGMATKIQEVSQNAERSAEVAAECLHSARLGTKAAGDNMNAMNGVRRQVQETAKRIKRLGERSQEIGQIVALIEDLSDRTSLLALNASLQAAAVGKTDSGFAVVAEEVERLAERSNRLTQQISGLTHAINLETSEVVASMEETIHEVIVGSTLADKAGRSLVVIEQVSGKLAELLRSISDSAKYQARSSEDVSNAMTGISEVTELVRLSSKRASGSVRSLVELSAELRDSVSPFKLPTETVPVKSPATEPGVFVN